MICYISYFNSIYNVISIQILLLGNQLLGNRDIERKMKGLSKEWANKM